MKPDFSRFKKILEPKPPKEPGKVAVFLNKYSLLVHIPLSLAMCFVLEWLSQHSFKEAMHFVTGHTGAYLYNSV